MEDPAVKIWAEAFASRKVCGLGSERCELGGKNVISRGGVNVAWGMVAFYLSCMIGSMVLLVMLTIHQ